MASVPPAGRSEKRGAISGGYKAKKIEVIPTDGVTPKEIPYTESSSQGAMVDHYRDGWFNEDGSTKAPKKTLAPIIKEPASIRMYGPNAEKAKKDTSSTSKTSKVKEYDFIPPYTKFILESVQEARQERSQIIETFGDFYVFFFGERPPIFTYSGTLINAQNVNWVQEFNYYYDNFLRGTKCVEKNARILLTYGNVQVEGFMLGFNEAMTAMDEQGVKITFSLVITKRIDTLNGNDFGLSEDAKKREEVVQAYLNELAGKSGTGMSEPAVSEAYNGVSRAMQGGPATQVINMV